MISPSITGLVGDASSARAIDANRRVKSLPLRGEQSNLAGHLHADSAIAVEFEFVRPGRRPQANFVTATASIGSTNPALLFATIITRA